MKRDKFRLKINRNFLAFSPQLIEIIELHNVNENLVGME